jgi:urea transport system permease protein
VGAFIVNGAKSWLTVAYPEFWLYFLGLLFIGVTLFLPNGVVGLVGRVLTRRGGLKSILQKKPSLKGEQP